MEDKNTYFRICGDRFIHFKDVHSSERIGIHITMVSALSYTWSALSRFADFPYSQMPERPTFRQIAETIPSRINIIKRGSKNEP